MKILDSSPLILFIDRINEEKCLHLLSSNGNIPTIPKSVYNEFKEKDNDNVLDGMVSNRTLDLLEGITTSEEDEIRNLRPGLGNGEVNVLAWALHLQKQGKDICCILDDGEARKFCQELGLPLKGSMGLIKLLKEERLLSKSEIEKIIDKIKESNFRVDEKILRWILSD
jgi:predicted nucleic acid-binding protein